MNEYTVVIGGVEHTMQLDDDEAKRLDAKPAGKASKSTSSKSSTPANKSRSASDK